MRGKSGPKLARTYIARRNAVPLVAIARPISASSASWRPVNGSVAGLASCGPLAGSSAICVSVCAALAPGPDASSSAAACARTPPLPESAVERLPLADAPVVPAEPPEACAAVTVELRVGDAAGPWERVPLLPAPVPPGRRPERPG
jgi:hypothetical protein